MAEEKMMRLPVTIYQDEDGWYVVECPVFPGCMSQGKTEQEAIDNIQEAIPLCLEVRREKDLPLTIHSLEDVAVIDGSIYVCDMGHDRICKINERTLEVASVADFTEAVWECGQVAGQLTVRLQSGIYLLN